MDLERSKETGQRKEQGEHSGRANIQGPGEGRHGTFQSESSLMAGVALGQVGGAQLMVSSETLSQGPRAAVSKPRSF